MSTEYGIKELQRDYGVLTFGNALESFRKCEEFSRKEFALMLGISSQSLCEIEKGRRIPSPSHAVKIARLIQQPVQFWLQLALQDMLRQENLDYIVSVA
ncbi:conserved hypothetical protein [Desulfamplus magnetovallimortis]|uniref:HTH cro/C1-type domain-containing protein n=1 Tax=Desulfamplus magnetovallimortis TaxID=1246637 RepID=A0A1W1HFM1_9BACT|nr:helix-turn-helix transcriptional regulator [Desulfamplus magnetovallimortis]SLM31270.1 conserved hypothetical protein [Desulfamplus magnetovallimortis]